METLLCLVLLFCVDVNLAFEDHSVSNVHLNHGHEYHHPSSYEYRNDHDVDESLDTHVDNYYDHIIRPCPIQDLKCIRHFLAHNFGCSPTTRSPAGPFILKEIELDVPLANVTFIIKKVQLRLLNTGRIDEFHIDKKTDTLVLQVTFDQFTIESPQITVVYYRKGKAPIEATDTVLAVMKGLSFTWTLRHMHDPHRVASHVYAHLEDVAATSISGPKLNGIGLELANNSWMADLPLAIREGMAYQAAKYMDAFLEIKICKLPHNVL